MALFEVFNEAGNKQLDENSLIVHEALTYSVTGSFSTQIEKSSIAIQPPENTTIYLYPEQSISELTSSYTVGNLSSGSMVVREFSNTSIPSSETFGLVLYNEQGLELFHSANKPLRIIAPFTSDPWNIPYNQLVYSYGDAVLLKNRTKTISFPTGRNLSNTALFLSSIGCEGGSVRKRDGGPATLYSYHRVQPTIRVENTSLILGYTHTQLHSRADFNGNNAYSFDGGIGHVSGYFIDIT